MLVLAVGWDGCRILLMCPIVQILGFLASYFLLFFAACHFSDAPHQPIVYRVIRLLGSSLPNIKGSNWITEQD